MIRAPALARFGTIRATVGIGLHRTIRTTGYPAPALTETGTVPAGLTFTDNGNGTAVLTGTPAAGSCGRYWIAIAAANPSGNSRPADLDSLQAARRLLARRCQRLHWNAHRGRRTGSPPSQVGALGVVAASEAS